MILAFDGDDTLWHNEDRFREVQDAFERLLEPWADARAVDERLIEIETENLPRFGYGAKSFTLSMIETAIDLSDNAIEPTAISRIMELGKHLLDRPAELLDGVIETLDRLTGHTMMIITKGDLHNQLMKVESSGLAGRMKWIEVVAEKDVATYAGVLDRHGIEPASFVMVGNSVRSDVLPVLEIGAAAIHVPYSFTWRHEAVAGGPEQWFPTLASITQLPDWLEGHS